MLKHLKDLYDSEVDFTIVFETIVGAEVKLKRLKITSVEGSYAYCKSFEIGDDYLEVYIRYTDNTSDMRKIIPLKRIVEANIF